MTRDDKFLVFPASLSSASQLSLDVRAPASLQMRTSVRVLVQIHTPSRQTDRQNDMTEQANDSRAIKFTSSILPICWN